MKFNLALKFLLEHEGGTNTDPIDRGGTTRWGISSKNYPNLDITNLPIEQASEIYRTDYWNRCKCGLFSENIAITLFDSAVNCGCVVASRWLQLAINRYSNADLIIDGVVGPKTLAAVELCQYGDIKCGIIAYRMGHYAILIKKHPEQIKFIRGWIIRCSELALYT